MVICYYFLPQICEILDCEQSLFFVWIMERVIPISRAGAARNKGASPRSKNSWACALVRRSPLALSKSSTPLSQRKITTARSLVKFISKYLAHACIAFRPTKRISIKLIYTRRTILSKRQTEKHLKTPSFL